MVLVTCYVDAVDLLPFNVAYPGIYQSDASIACRVSDQDPLETLFVFNTGTP